MTLAVTRQVRVTGRFVQARGCAKCAQLLPRPQAKAAGMPEAIPRGAGQGFRLLALHRQPKLPRNAAVSQKAPLACCLTWLSSRWSECL